MPIMDPAYANRLHFSGVQQPKYGGVDFGGNRPDWKITPSPQPPPYNPASEAVGAERGGGIIGKAFGGMAYGWQPKRAVRAAPAFVAEALKRQPHRFNSTPIGMLPTYVCDQQTVQAMSYTRPVSAPAVPRPERLGADGLRGEFAPRPTVGHRSIGGHEAWPL